MYMLQYNSINKMEIIEENQMLKEKLASVCLAAGVRGDEARDLSPKDLRAFAEYIIATRGDE